MGGLTVPVGLVIFLVACAALWVAAIVFLFGDFVSRSRRRFGSAPPSVSALPDGAARGADPSSYGDPTPGAR